MKYFITAACTCILMLCFQQVKAQIKFPPDFDQQVKQEYEQFGDKDVPFSEYLSVQKRIYTEKAMLASKGAAAYDGCDKRNTPCGNGDFESGLDTNEWDGALGSITIALPDAIPANMIEGFSPAPGTTLPANDPLARQTIVGAGFDVITGISTVAPGGSTQSLRLGNSITGSGAELISKRFTVSADQTVLSFMYAVVMQNPATNHTAAEQPTFRVRVVDCATGLELTGVCNLGNNFNMVIANDLTYPYFRDTTFNGQPLVFTPWLCAQINLSQHVGKTVNVQFINEDCSKSGHFGYTYLDNVCATTNCPTGEINVASAPGCGTGQICFDYILPMSNDQTGSIQISLNIYQNGNILQTIPGPVLTTGNTYCFTVNPNSVPGINTSAGGYDFSATASFVLNGFPLAPITVGNPPDGQTSGQNNDVLISCLSQCCPGKNHIKNPGFEDGNTSFYSGYNYTPFAIPGSVYPGRYSVLTSAQGLTVSPTWDVNCAANGRHLFVNGFTGTPGTRIVWSQNVTIHKGKIYKFCVDMKNLPQCGFDVKPRVNVLFSLVGYDLTNQIIDVPAGSCNWQSVNQVLYAPPGSGPTGMTITITLDETPVGDGNDLAIDNLTLVEISEVPESEVYFDIEHINITPTTYGISATPVAPLRPECGYYWEVSEIDDDFENIPGTAVYNPAQWWIAPPNTFIGYVGSSTLTGVNDGVFEADKKYKIVYARWCPCEAFNPHAIYLDPKRSSITHDPSYTMSAQQISAIQHGEDVRRFAEATDSKNKTTKSVIAAEVNALNTISIYPNPVDDNMTVTLPSSAGKGSFIVYNMQGQQMFIVPYSDNDSRKIINTSTLAPGSYIIQCRKADNSILAKQTFIKLRK